MKKEINFLRISLLAILVVAAVTSCGIKPNRLDAPNTENKTTFPATYPQK